MTTWNEPETSATLWQMHLSASESSTGMAFLFHRWLRHPPPTPTHPRKPSSLRLTHLFDPLFISLSYLFVQCPSLSLSLTLWSVSSHFLAIPSGNYYKSESQSIFNPRRMVFGSNGETSADESAVARSVVTAEVQRGLMQQCQ